MIVAKLLALTYMSIRDEIKYRIGEERLWLLSPVALPGAKIMRPMFISNEIKGLVLGPWDDPEWGRAVR
jgi:hypothetical protein